MKRFFRLSMIVLALSFCCLFSATAQDCKKIHKVKKGETIFGIARENGITIEELVKANPVMSAVGYELKKGDQICIPYPAKQSGVQTQKPLTPVQNNAAVNKKQVTRIGFMLPLHNVDGDGRRMVEYYRGFLMACDKLKREGADIQVRAWNVAIDSDINQVLQNDGAKDCDMIFGPLYTKQVPALAAFTRQHGIKMVIPFSISGSDVEQNANIFQVYQKPELFYGGVVKQFVNRFADCHVVVIDCNDQKSDKGVFTFNLRKELEKLGRSCSITNLNNSDEYFAKAFDSEKRNIVVLNTGRSPELTSAIQKLDQYRAQHPSTKISLFGYTEWLMYEKYNLEKFFRYDTYIPTCAYYNAKEGAIRQFESDYNMKFKQQMMDYTPRFAITGYDHAMYFIRGLRSKGQNFTGSEPDKDALQTQLHFVRTGATGGFQNNSFMFVHYNTNRSISVITF